MFLRTACVAWIRTVFDPGTDIWVVFVAVVPSRKGLLNRLLVDGVGGPGVVKECLTMY